MTGRELEHANTDVKNDSGRPKLGPKELRKPMRDPIAGLSDQFLTSPGLRHTRERI